MKPRFNAPKKVNRPRIPMNTTLRAARACFFLVALCVAPAISVAADDGPDVFTVLDVKVDVTAKAAAAARVLARAEGHKAAFRRLITRLVPRDRHAGVPEIDADGIAALVRDFEVDEEKTSHVRYLGKLKFRFKKQAVRNFLKSAGVQFAETRSKPLLVLPVYRAAGVYLLWDNPNPWRAAWAALPPADGLVPMILPAGNLADVNDISPRQAVDGDADRLRAITRRYRTAGTVLALASLGRDRARRRPVLEVTVTRFATIGEDRTIVRSFTAKPGMDVNALIGEAARAMSARIEEDWKLDNLLRFDRRGELVAVVPVKGLPDWVAMERKLSGIAFVRNSELVSLSRREATVRLRFLGDEEQLALALAQRDVSLDRGPVSWILRMAVSRDLPNDGAGDNRNGTRP